MFGFGFIMSLIFFSLGSVGFSPPDGPLSMKPVLYRASANKKQKIFCSALGHSPRLPPHHPALGEQGVCILGTLTS